MKSKSSLTLKSKFSKGKLLTSVRIFKNDSLGLLFRKLFCYEAVTSEGKAEKTTH